MKSVLLPEYTIAQRRTDGLKTQFVTICHSGAKPNFPLYHDRWYSVQLNYNKINQARLMVKRWSSYPGLVNPRTGL